MQTKNIDIAETQTNLKELLSLVREGTEIILSEGETQVAKIVAISSPTTPLRQPGLQPRIDFNNPRFRRTITRRILDGKIMKLLLIPQYLRQFGNETQLSPRCHCEAVRKRVNLLVL